MSKPKVFLPDIETSPLVLSTWGLLDQNIGLNQIKDDWSVLSWAAKWLGEKKLMYQDVRHQKNKRDDKAMLAGIWHLLDEADIVVGREFQRLRY